MQGCTPARRVFVVARRCWMPAMAKAEQTLGDSAYDPARAQGGTASIWLIS